jgi:hypothetical protein
LIEPRVEAQEAYTFLGLGVDGATRFMDVALLSPADVDGHAEALLHQHGSSAKLEIWREAQLVAIKARDERATT